MVAMFFCTLFFFSSIREDKKFALLSFVTLFSVGDPILIVTNSSFKVLLLAEDPLTSAGSCFAVVVACSTLDENLLSKQDPFSSFTLCPGGVENDGTGIFSTDGAFCIFDVFLFCAGG